MYIKRIVLTSDVDDLSTLAFPGTACLNGYMTACTRTLVASGRSYTQTWCCPTGGWSCATDYDVLRQCISLLSTSTTAWVLGTGGHPQAMVLSALEAGQEPYSVYRLVFPLEETASGASGMSTTQSDSTYAAATGAASAGTTASQTTTNPAGSVATAGSQQAQPLSAGVAAGIAVGCCVFLFLLVGLASWVFVQQRRRARAAVGGGGGGGIGEGPTMGEGAVKESPSPAELPTARLGAMSVVQFGNRQELEAAPIVSTAELPATVQNRLAMVELPAQYRVYGHQDGAAELV